MEHLKKFKILQIVKILIFNLFFIGFILNLISYVNAYCIVSGDSYIIGIFQYCKRFNEFEVDSNGVNNSSNIIHLKKVYKCIKWSYSNRPSIKNIFFLIFFDFY